MKQLDVTGQKFGKLTVIRENGKKYRSTAWLCRCECGCEKTIVGYSLREGKSQSCGCVKTEFIGKLNKRDNLFDLSGEYGIGYLNDDKEQFLFDKEDYEKIKDYCWYKSNSGYVIHDRQNQKSILLHRLITNCPEELVVDHINHDKLDNRKSNLRVCTHADNQKNLKSNSRNTSGHLGVCHIKSRDRWQSYIYINKKKKTLGNFKNKEDAIRVREEAEKKYYGEFAFRKETV